jgi:hypothetical protein
MPNIIFGGARTFYHHYGLWDETGQRLTLAEASV